MASVARKDVKLLFFDTFYHDQNKEELNLDLIQFAEPVIVYELRVIPLKTQVEPNLGKGYRLGGTLPSEFKLDVFVNNLEKPNSATFERLGQLDYKENKNIQLKPDREVATDGLILKGWYRTVTLAVYGWVTVVKQDSPPPPPPPLSGHLTAQSKGKIPGLDISDDESKKPAPQQQHKLDFLNEQVQKRQQQLNATPSSSVLPSSRDSHKQDEPFELQRKLSPRRDLGRDRGSSHDIHDPHESGHDNDYTFPPEPKEPYELRDKGDRDRSRSHERDRDFVRRTSRDDDRPHSREDRERDHRRDRLGRHGSRESDGRDSRGRSRERSREPRDSKDSRDSLETERIREIKLEVKDRDFEQREKDKEKEREKERELDREKEQRDRDLKEREQNEKEKEKEREAETERERERVNKERELEIEKEKLLERETRSKDQNRQVSKQSTSVRSRSRSGSRSRRRSLSPAKSRSSRSRKRSRSRSKEVHKPPEPQFGNEEEDEEEEEEGGPEDEEMEDQELYTPVTGRRRYRGLAYDGDDREVVKEYEDISSEDEMVAIEDPNMMQVLDLYELEDDPWGGFHTLNPVEFYLSPLVELKNPGLSSFEVEQLRYANQDSGSIEMPQEARDVMNIILEFSQEEHEDKWVVAVEELPDLLEKGLSFLMTQKNKDTYVDTLVNWAVKGCDPDVAMAQPDAAFKVRHLKAGIRLAGCMSVLNEQIALILLKKGIQSKLLSLIESELIVFSIKHLALRSLSKTTHFPVGTQWFLGVHSDYNKQDNVETGYQRLVQNLLSEKIVKLTMSMTALLRKIHFYETLMNLYNVVERIMSTSPMPDESSSDEEEQPQLKDEDENKILADLSEATKIFADPHLLIGQQHNAVPYTLLVDNTTRSSESLETIYNIADSCGLLECLFALLTYPATSACPSVYLSVHTILQKFMSTQGGLLYLCSHPDVTNGIIRCLLQMVEEPEDSGDDIPSRQLGLELVYHLQVIQYVDQLYHCQTKANKPVDDPEVIVVLHGLYTMTYSAANRDPLLGRNILSKVLSFDRNVEVLLPYLDRTGDEEYDLQMKRSVSASCSIQLLLIVIKTSTDITMLSNYGHRLLALCEDGGSAKLCQLQEWLAPVKKVTSFDLDGLPSIIAQLKQYTDDVKKVSPGLITIVRMIYSLVSDAAATATVDNLETLNEAKYRYVIVELYSSECFPIFINILQKLSESQLKVWQQGIPYTTDQWLTYFSLIKPTLSMVHATLCQLIQAFRAEGKEASKSETENKDPLNVNPFKDLTSIPVLLELHTVMCSVPTSSLYNNDLAKIQRDIVDTLLAFTQEELQETQTDDALSRSLWTLMLKELLKYTIKSPYTYMSGLLILSELLPLPFPLLTKDPLSNEEMDAAVMARKLWSVHLQSATPELFSVLDTLSGTGCQPLQHLMRRVCWQIADLAAPSSLRITKILLDILMVNLKPKKPTQPTDVDKKEGEEEPTAVRSVSIYTAKTLNLLAYLLSHPGIKAALLQLIGTSINNDAKYNEFLPIMLQLLNQTTETAAEIQTQEGIVSMIQNVCDLEVSMVNTDLPVTLAEHLANSLPETILMDEIMAALLEHIGNTCQSYASILPCLRILIMLTDHDYGFYLLKKNLSRNITVLHTLLNRINNTFSKDSSDCLSTLSSVLELLRVMTAIDQGEDMAVTRTKVISREELRNFLLWNPDVRHPLEELEELSREEETLESILESITALTNILRCPPDVPQEGDTNVESIVLPLPASLTDLFNQRVIFTILDSEDERLSPSYWLANPASDEPDADPEVLRCDLQAICEHHLPDFNLEEELKKETSTAEEDIVRPKRPKDRRKSHEIININRGGKTGRKPFVAPMRGRGIMSHGLLTGNRSNDLFRTRAANTSRPPSMHVDDFVKLEIRQHQQEQQPQQHQQQPLRPPMTPPIIILGNRDIREKADELSRGRGFDRGRGFGIPPRGRFYTPPAPYSRREAMLHEVHPPPPPVPHPSTHRGTRGGLLSLDRSRANFMAPRQFPRGSERQGPPPDRHGNRNGRFSPGRVARGNQWGRGRDVGEAGRFAGGGFRGRRDGGRHVRSFTK